MLRGAVDLVRDRSKPPPQRRHRHFLKRALPLLKAIPTNAFKVTAKPLAGEAALAIDANLESRWRSGAPQQAGMYFELDFNQPQRVCALEYKLGAFAHDYPRALNIEGQLENGQIIELLNSSDYGAIKLPNILTAAMKPHSSRS